MGKITKYTMHQKCEEAEILSKLVEFLKYISLLGTTTFADAFCQLPK